MVNIITVKHGIKYSADYVNKMYSMCRRHITLPFDFFCFTDNIDDIDSDINIIRLPNHKQIAGWWWKPFIFDNHFQQNDTNFYIDLDMVIVNNIDHIIQYKSPGFIGLKNVNRCLGRYHPSLGSAVMKWQSGQFTGIHDAFFTDPVHIMKKFRGDQDFIWSLHKEDIEFFPDEWIKSYKWEIRSREDLIVEGNRYKFSTIATPIIAEETAILAFHGSPFLHETCDPVIVENWR